jgi:hypothetical protein
VNASEKTQGDKTLFAVSEPIIFKGKDNTLENAKRVHKIQPVIIQIADLFDSSQENRIYKLYTQSR